MYLQNWVCVGPYTQPKHYNFRAPVLLSFTEFLHSQGPHAGQHFLNPTWQRPENLIIRGCLGLAKTQTDTFADSDAQLPFSDKATCNLTTQH